MYAENRGVKNYMKDDQRSNRRNFCSCGKESLKKSGLYRIRTLDLCDTGAALLPIQDDDEVMNIWKSYKRMTQIIIIH